MSEFFLMTATRNKRTHLLYSVVEFANILNFVILPRLKKIKKIGLQGSLPTTLFCLFVCFQDKEETSAWRITRKW